MFEGLRKKFSNFIGGLAKKEKEEVEEAEKVEENKEEPQQAAEVKEEQKTQTVKTEEPKKVEEQKSEPVKVEEPAKEERKSEPEKVDIKKAETQSRFAEEQEEKRIQAERRIAPPRPPMGAPMRGVKTTTMGHGMRQAAGQPVQVKPKEERYEEFRQEVKPAYQEQPKQEEPKPEQKPAYQEPQKQAPQPKVTFTTRLKSVIFRQVKISDKDADPFIEALKMDLLQSDVNYDVTDKIAASIRNGLVGKPVDSKNIEGEITNTIRSSILGVLSSSPEIDILQMINRKKESGELPFKIMFIGPNGAGKTTTMAKIANMLLSNNITCVLSASDTFRAAAIEQTVIHAGRLGINVIKGNYGSDPSSVAFDAIAHAKAHGIMAVLIDSAGRQETNKSLIEELKKMTRVTAPDLKVFVGEAISGNALLDQVKAINEAVKIDGIILTKLDVDAKGGNTISILSDTTVPILFFGTGEKYTDIMRYDPKFIIDNILPSQMN